MIKCAFCKDSGKCCLGCDFRYTYGKFWKYTWYRIADNWNSFLDNNLKLHW